MSYLHPDCPSLRSAYAQLLDRKQKCKLALEEAKRTGNVGPAWKLISLWRKKTNELGKRVSPFWEEVDVTYKMPSFEELKRRIKHVHPIFDEKFFEPIASCKHVSREPRKIRFEIVETNKRKTTYEILQEMKTRGLRPALFEELLDFSEKHPEECAVVALGSSASDGINRCVAYLRGGGNTRCLDSRFSECSWFPNTSFLAVRE